MSTKIRPNDIREGDVITVKAKYAVGKAMLAKTHDGNDVISLEDGTRLEIPANAELFLESREAPDLSKHPFGAVIKVTVGTGKANTWMLMSNAWGDRVWINQHGITRVESAFAHEQLRMNKWEVFL